MTHVIGNFDTVFEGPLDALVSDLIPKNEKLLMYRCIKHTHACYALPVAGLTAGHTLASHSGHPLLKTRGDLMFLPRPFSHQI